MGRDYRSRRGRAVREPTSSRARDVGPTLAPGTVRYLQGIVLDPAAVEWFAFTNALQVTTRR